jgi:hypoxanthine phosphoribosyltransferase
LGEEEHQEEKMKEFLTNAQMNGYYADLVREMANVKYRPSVIVAPLRGGADIGLKLSHYFSCPLETIVWQTRDGEERDTTSLRNILSLYSKGNILIVDDICDTGKTLSEIESVIDQWCAEYTFWGEIDTAVALFKESSEFVPNWYSRSIYEDEENTWFVFPWEEWWK